MCNNKNNNKNNKNNGNIRNDNFERRSINESCTITKSVTRPRPKPPSSSSKENE